MLGTVASLAGAAVSAYGAAKMNERNIASQQNENAIMRSREDSAYQRAVWDARQAGLSPLAVLGTGGASSQPAVAPLQTENSLGQGVSTFLQSENNHAIVAYNNAMASKAIEETKGQAINNSFASADYEARIQKLLDEAENIRAKTDTERKFQQEYIERLQAELEGLRLANSAKSQDIAFKIHDAKIFDRYGLPYSSGANLNFKFGDKYALGVLAGNGIVNAVSDAKIADKVNKIADKVNEGAKSYQDSAYNRAKSHAASRAKRSRR